MDGDLGGDLGPEAGVADGHHGLLRVAVHVHVQHEAAEGGPEVVGQAVVEHAAQDQIHGELAGDLVDGQVLTVQTHFSKQVELVPREEAGREKKHRVKGRKGEKGIFCLACVLLGKAGVAHGAAKCTAVTCNR